MAEHESVTASSSPSLLVTACLSRIQEAEASLAAARWSLLQLGDGFLPTNGGTLRVKEVDAVSDVCAQPSALAAAVSSATAAPPSGSSPAPACEEPQAAAATSPPSAPRRRLEFQDQVVLDTIVDYQPPQLRFSDTLLQSRTELTRRRCLPSSLCCLPARCVLHPDSKKRFFWDLLGLMFIIFETFAIPVYVCFNVKPEGNRNLFVVASVIDTYFIVDIMMSFMTGYRTNKGVLVMAPSRIAKRYSRSWLLPDVLAGIPWEWLSGIPLNRNVAQFTKMLRLARVARLLRLLKHEILSDRVKMMIEAKPLWVFAFGTSKVVFMLFGITHWAACIWYYIGTHSKAATKWTDTHIPAGADLVERYVYALYFTLTTMTTVGYGDITPSNYTEVGFVSVLLLVATVVFAALMGSLTDLIANLNSEKNLQNERVFTLSRYMSWRHVPQDLFIAVRRHLLYLWETNRGYDAYEAEIKEQLPPALKKELCFHIYGKILRSMPFLGWLKDFDVCLKDLSEMVHLRVFGTGDTIFRMGQPNQECWILLTGRMRVSLNNSLFQYSAADEEESIASEDEEHHHDHHEHHAHAHDHHDDHHDRKDPSHRRALRSALGFSGKPKVTKTGKHGGSADLFNAQVLAEASKKLLVQDRREKWAARFIQRRWKSKERYASGEASTRSGARKTVTSKSVIAPAYFGESFLWTPPEEWGSVAATYAYTARCECRSELLLLGHAEVQELLDRHSPWLPERLQYYAELVEECMRELGFADNAVEPSVSPTTACVSPAAAPAPDARVSNLACGVNAAPVGTVLEAARAPTAAAAARWSPRWSPRGGQSGLGSLGCHGGQGHSELLLRPRHLYTKASASLAHQSRSGELALRSQAAVSRLMATSLSHFAHGRNGDRETAVVDAGGENGGDTGGCGGSLPSAAPAARPRPSAHGQRGAASYQANLGFGLTTGGPSEAQDTLSEPLLPK